MQQQKWSFTGSFEDFPNPPLLQFFLTHLLFGSHALDVSGMRDKEVNKVVDVVCQFVVQNTRTDRQVKHQPKANEEFKQAVKTPLTVGLPLAIHSRVRDKNLVNTLSDVISEVTTSSSLTSKSASSRVFFSVSLKREDFVFPILLNRM